MVCKLKNKPQTILEPSAGKGDIIDHLTDGYRYQYRNIHAIEKDETLQATLRGKGVKVIDSDFLTFAGPDKYDAIIANPPFDEGDKHLLKAIDIMYCGEIVFLLNAETIRNPYTNTRKVLVHKLSELNAEIEYIPDAFLTAERRTKVEIALVYINIERQVEDDLFKGVTDTASDTSETIEPDHEIQTKNNIKNMVDDYNRVVKVGTETLLGYYRNYNHIGEFIQLKENGDEGNLYYHDSATLTQLMQDKLNGFLRDVRKHYWSEVLELKPVTDRLTSHKRDLFYHQVEKQTYMDFTEYNIRSFILNIIDGYEQTLTDAVVALFDEMSKKYAWDDNNEFEKNIHYFNGWKTNKAFFVNEKVVIPYYHFWDVWGSGVSNGKWKVNYQDTSRLHDIDLVMNYFDGRAYYTSIIDALGSAFEREQTRKVLSTFFEISVFKKGTLHLTFRDENIRRRFNIAACKGKGWLPQDYGAKPFTQLPYDEQAVVESFEGKKSYSQNVGKSIFNLTDLHRNLLAA